MAMSDTTIKKVEAASSPRGEMGQRYLVAGKRVSMRLWDLEPGREVKLSTSRDYETVGYVISGSAKLELEGQILLLKEGDCWLVPAGAVHRYNIIEHSRPLRRLRHQPRCTVAMRMEGELASDSRPPTLSRVALNGSHTGAMMTMQPEALAVPLGSFQRLKITLAALRRSVGRVGQGA
jgi:quercetin dioxygenase-like cupin family protein